MNTKRKPLSFTTEDVGAAIVQKVAAGPTGQTEEPRRPIGARVSVSVYRRAKARAAIQGAKLQDWVEGAILEKLAKDEAMQV